MRTESEETKDEVNNVINNLRVCADLTDASLERSSISHDAQ